MALGELLRVFKALGEELGLSNSAVAVWEGVAIAVLEALGKDEGVSVRLGSTGLEVALATSVGEELTVLCGAVSEGEAVIAMVGVALGTSTVGLALAVPAGLAVSVADGLIVGVAELLGVAESVSVSVMLGVAVGLGVCVSVAVLLGVACGVGEALKEAEGVLWIVSDGVGLSVGVLVELKAGDEGVKLGVAESEALETKAEGLALGLKLGVLVDPGPWVKAGLWVKEGNPPHQGVALGWRFGFCGSCGLLRPLGLSNQKGKRPMGLSTHKGKLQPLIARQRRAVRTKNFLVMRNIISQS